MKIIINTSKLRFGGALQVALSLIYECRAFPENEYHVFVGQGLRKSLKEEDFPDNFFFYPFDFGVLNLFNIRKIASELSAFEAQIQPDCVVTTSGPAYWKPKAPHLMGFNLGKYIYPDSPYFGTVSRYARFRYGIKRKIHLRMFKREATALIVQTDDVNQRIRKALNMEHVFTVTNTHSGFFKDWQEVELPLPSKGPDEIWILTLTSYYIHKNIEIIPSILEELQKKGYTRVRFVVTLGESTYEHVFNGQQVQNIINVGTVRPEQCPSLYARCDYMFLPSLAECFSASYPEAMVMKKPIITTDLSFARSICGDAALFYKPMDGRSAAEAIEQVMQDQDLRSGLIERGLKRLDHFDTAKERAEKILGICHRMDQLSKTL
jgi:glycosyltransferase involved in cell wall biosynthesis